MPRARAVASSAARLLAEYRPALLALTASAPLRIDGQGDVGGGGWLVESGEVDLFAVTFADDTPGARYPLGTFRCGELLLLMPSAPGQRVIAVGGRDAAVRRLSGSDIAAWPLAEGASLIDGWIAKLAAAAFGERPAAAAAAATAAEPGARVELDAGQTLGAGRGVAWVVPRQGRLRLAGSAAVLDGLIPMAAGMQLCAETDATVVECLAGEDALAGGFGDAGLRHFQAAVSAALAALIARDEEAARQRLAARGAFDQQSVDGAVQMLASVAGIGAAPPAPLLGGDATVAALATVAAHQGMALTRLPRFAGPAEGRLLSLARANGFGAREVLLRDRWWRADNGALLGRCGNERRPVALLPTARASYRLWDPADGSSTVVDERVAAEIAPHAIMLYRPLPENSRGLAGLIRFAGRGLRREIATIVAMGVLAGVVAALLPLAIGYLFGSAVPRAETGQAIAVVGGLVVAAFGAGAFEVTKAIALVRLEGRLEAAMQPALMHRLIGLPVNFFRGFGTGDLTNRVLSIQTMRRLLAGNTLVSLLSALFALTSFFVILLYSPILALLSAAVVAFSGGVIGGLALLELRQERARTALRGQEDGLLVQIMQGIAKLRVAACENRMFAVWARLFAQQKRRFLAAQRYAVAGEAFADVFPSVALLALLYVAAQLWMPGRSGTAALGLNAFLAINAAFGQLLAATIAMARSAATVLDLVPLFERLRPILAAPPEARADKSEAAPLSGRIELSHVSFRYGAGTRLVLEDISLRIEPGEFVAFVGPSGSGKSTVLRLLLGFETADRGDILFDGQSITTLDAGSLRRQIGVVLQHSRVTTGSIFHNLTSGLPYTLEDAWTAARLAGIAADIEAMPMGMHTLLMEGSSTLSGGQRQRLMIGRALIGRPRILLFDEATSALDNRSQAVVMEALERLDATRIVIAHRLSTVERAERIVVLDRGCIVETGTHGELIAVGGPFSRLARRQTL